MYEKYVKRSLIMAILAIFFFCAIWPASAFDVQPYNAVSPQNVNLQSYSIAQDVSASWQLFNHTLRGKDGGDGTGWSNPGHISVIRQDARH
jgi:hypothetical protein